MARRGSGPLPRWGEAALVGLVAFVAFLPGLFGDFVGWDDDRNFLENLAYRGLGPDHVRWMFTTWHMGHYRPLTWLSHGVDYVLWGMNPRGYHLASLFFHALSAVTFLLVARRLLRASLPAATGEGAVRLGAAGAALLFAVHPLRVEAVTWLSSRADVLSGLLALATVLAYLRACDPRTAHGRRWYWGAVGAFALALLSKSIVLTLPLVLLILDVYPLRRLGAGAGGWFGRQALRVWAEKAPFAVLSAGAAVIAILARIDFGSVLEWSRVGAAGRVGAVGYGLAFYLWKMLLPLGLSPLYDFWARTEGPVWPFVLSGGVALAVTALAILRRRRWPALLAVWAGYAVILLPVSGIVQNGPQIAADRYTYLACLGWALLFGAGLAACAKRWSDGTPSRLPVALLGLAATVIVILAGLASWQTLIWQDSKTLWTHAAGLEPRSPFSQSNLGGALLAEGRVEAASARFAEAVRLTPGFPEARMGLAFTLLLEKRPDEALVHAREAVRRSPRSGRMRLALYEFFRLQGNLEESLAALRAGARLEPGSAEVRYNMALVLAEMGKAEEAAAALAEGDRLAGPVAAGRPERKRLEALVWGHFDPQRAIEAWERYVLAVARLRHPTQREAKNLLDGLTALTELRKKAEGPVSGR